MLLRTVGLALLAATSIAAHAAPALTTALGPPWPPAGSTGLQSVQFVQDSTAEGDRVALGAHAYKNGAFLQNNQDPNNLTFTAAPGLYPAPPLRANWSFDFAYSIDSNCSECHAFLGIDTDFGPGFTPTFIDLSTIVNPDTHLLQYGSSGADSWNMKMNFLNGLGFNENATTSTTFFLFIAKGSSPGTSLPLTNVGITVNVVPEPGTLALVGLALAGAGVLRRRKS